MEKIVHLSLARKDVPTKMDVVQFATEPSILFVLDDYLPVLGAVANIYIQKPSGHLVYNACSVDGNELTYNPTTQSFAEEGVNECQLHIVEPNGTAISFLIFADVHKCIIDSSAVESQDEFTALEEALQTVSDYDGRITSNTNRLDNLGDEHVTFEEAQTDTTISDNLTLSTIFGRIKHLFTRTKTLEDTHVEKVSPATVATVDCFPSGNPPQRVRLNVADNNENSYRAIFTDKGICLWHDQSSSNLWSMNPIKKAEISIVLQDQSWTRSGAGIYYLSYANSISISGATNPSILAVSLNNGWAEIRPTDYVEPIIAADKISLLANTNTFYGANSKVGITVLYI